MMMFSFDICLVFRGDLEAALAELAQSEKQEGCSVFVSPQGIATVLGMYQPIFLSITPVIF